MATAMDEPTSPAPDGDPLQAGLEQFRRAALDAVRAARAMLDAAEAVLEDPATVDTVARTVSSAARSATDVFAGFAPPDPSRPATAPDESDGETGADTDGTDGGVERIPVD